MRNGEGVLKGVDMEVHISRCFSVTFYGMICKIQNLNADYTGYQPCAGAKTTGQRKNEGESLSLERLLVHCRKDHSRPCSGGSTRTSIRSNNGDTGHRNLTQRPPPCQCGDHLLKNSHLWPLAVATYRRECDLEYHALSEQGF